MKSRAACQGLNARFERRCSVLEKVFPGHDAGIGSGHLPRVSTGETLVCEERSNEARQPEIRIRLRVLHEEDYEVTARSLDGNVAGCSMVELRRFDFDQPIDLPAQQCRRAVLRAGVDGHDLEGQRRLLRPDRSQSCGQGSGPVARAQNDRDQRRFAHRASGAAPSVPAAASSYRRSHSRASSSMVFTGGTRSAISTMR